MSALDQAEAARSHAATVLAEAALRLHIIEGEVGPDLIDAPRAAVVEAIERYRAAKAHARKCEKEDEREARAAKL